MEKKKKYMIGSVVVVLIVGILLSIQYVLNKDTEKMKEEEEIYKTMDITTKGGMKISTEYNKFDDGSFLIKLPITFTRMSEDMVQTKYPNGNPPTFVFTNEGTTVNVAVSLSDVAMKNSDIKEYLTSLETSFAEYYTILDTNLFERDGRNIGEIEFLSTATDTDIYNHFLVFSTNDKLRIITFNCTKELQEQWQEVGDFIVDSIMFPEN